MTPVYAIAPTMYNEDGSVDVGAICENAARLSGYGVRQFLIAGAYGEAHSLAPDEKVRIVASLMKRLPDCRVMAAAVEYRPQDVVSTALALAEVGAAEIMVTGPFGIECSEADVAEHLRVLGDDVGGPLVVYNNPAFGLDLTDRALDVIGAHPAYVGIKQGTSDIRRAQRALMLQAAGHLKVMVASDVSGLPILCSGAWGLTSTNVWVFPEAITEMVNRAGSGDTVGAFRIRAALEPYVQCIASVGQPALVKTAMTLDGYAGTRLVRRPLRSPGLDDVERVRVVLADTRRRLAQELDS